jgi:pimeloyl-ACP methyl ester carboxylesterase
MSTLLAIVLAGLLGGLSGPVAQNPEPSEPAQLERPATPDPAAFRAWFERESQHPTELPAAAVKIARAYRYVFIAGFLNEGIQPGYFNQNRLALLDVGVNADAIDIVFPGSGRGIEENAAVLLSTLAVLAAKGPQKLVLIGHSKGAAETLAFIVAAPVFVREHVQAVFMVQGAFGGSGVADFVRGTGQQLDGRMPRFQREAFRLAAKAGMLLDGQLDAGFDSLSRQRATALWDRLLPADQGTGESRLPAGLGNRIFFVRSQRSPDKVCPLLSLTARYLATYYGPNDGLLVISDQWIPGAGQLLADLDADHSDLTVSGPVSSRPARTRRAFTHALLMQLAGAFLH